MENPPTLLIVIDSERENIAVLEAQKKNIPIVAVVDTNGDPEQVGHPVPGNDDAIRSIKLFASKFTEAIAEGMKKRAQKETQVMAAAQAEAEAPVVEAQAAVAENEVK